MLESQAGMSEAGSIKRSEQLKAALHKYRRTGPVQTSLGTWEQGLTLPFTTIAEMIDDSVAKESADALLKASMRLLLSRTNAARMEKAMDELLEAVEAYKQASRPGQALAGVVDERREELVENVRELLDAMASPKQGTTRLPGRDWQVKNAAGIVEDNLIALRNMIVVQRQQAGTTKDRVKEPFMEEAQQLVSSLMGGNEERAEYHAQRLSGSAEYHAQRLSGSLEDVSIGDSETPEAAMAML